MLQARLTISSPLEAHKSNTIVFHIVGVDVGFENPLFACLEIDYEEADNDPTGLFILVYRNQGCGSGSFSAGSGKSK